MSTEQSFIPKIFIETFVKNCPGCRARKARLTVVSPSGGPSAPPSAGPPLPRNGSYPPPDPYHSHHAPPQHQQQPHPHEPPPRRVQRGESATRSTATPDVVHGKDELRELEQEQEQELQMIDPDVEGGHESAVRYEPGPGVNGGISGDAPGDVNAGEHRVDGQSSSMHKTGGEGSDDGSSDSSSSSEGED